MYKDIKKQQAWNNEYNKRTYKQIAFRIRADRDTDIDEYIESIKASGKSFNEYIIELIRADMVKNK